MRPLNSFVPANAISSSAPKSRILRSKYRNPVAPSAAPQLPNVASHEESPWTCSCTRSSSSPPVSDARSCPRTVNVGRAEMTAGALTSVRPQPLGAGGPHDQEVLDLLGDARGRQPRPDRGLRRAL